MTLSRLQILPIFLGVVLGGFIFWLHQWWQAGWPTAGRQVREPVHIDVVDIAPEDEWVKNFETYALKPDGIETKREYLLLILVRKNNTVKRVEYPARQSRFILYASDEPESELVLGINPSQLNESTQGVYTLLLDFGGNLFIRDRVKVLTNLKISSIRK